MPERKEHHEHEGARRKPLPTDLFQMILRRLEFLTEKLELVHNAVHRLESKQEMIMADLTRLTQEVSETSTAIDSAIALINGLAEQIRNLEPNQAALNAFADTLDAKANELAAAVTDNTPPVETPPEPTV